MDVVSFLKSFINFEKLLLYVIYTILAGFGSFVGWVVWAYNSLVQVRRRADEAYANIETQLKRRNDLVPNLVESVRGYAEHERGALENVTRARTQALGAQTPQGRAEAENMLSNTLKTLFAVAENYPDLKASQNFLELQRKLSDIEDAIQQDRRAYNEAVRELSVKIESIPLNFVAIFFRFKKGEFIKIAEEEKKVPKVRF